MAGGLRSKSSNNGWTDARDTDIVVPVIGDTGAGKSHFINKVLRSVGREDAVEEGEELTSCTTDIQPVVVEGQTENYTNLKGRRIVLVDCPGFDVDRDPKADFELLRRLADWLKNSYLRGTVLGGIVYLHDISATRCRPDGFQKKLEKLNQLYDDKVPFSAVVFVTSKWGYDAEAVSARREAQYQEEHWKNVLKPQSGENGARVMRLKPKSKAGSKLRPDPEESSAWEIVGSILKEVEARAVAGLMSEVQRIEGNPINAKDARAAADLRVTLEKYRQAEERVIALQESSSGDGDSDSDRRWRLDEAEKSAQHHSQRIRQKLAHSLLDRLSRLSRWFFSS